MDLVNNIVECNSTIGMAGVVLTRASKGVLTAFLVPAPHGSAVGMLKARA